jgi:spore coat polysaccharide biosynthesis protein SpsF
MRIGVVLQARMGSKRLPGKTLMPILGRPMIYYVIERLKQIELAVPDGPQDAVLSRIAQDQEIEFFAGSEDDVLDRYYRAAEFFELDHIYRATGDNPLIEAEIQDQLIRYHLKGGYEYTEHLFSLPHGLGGEIFSYKGLQRCWELSDGPHLREGVNDYILENRDLFHTGRPRDNPYTQAAMDRQWTVDTQEQFEEVLAIYEELYEAGKTIRVSQVLDIVAGEKDCPCRV